MVGSEEGGGRGRSRTCNVAVHLGCERGGGATLATRCAPATEGGHVLEEREAWKMQGRRARSSTRPLPFARRGLEAWKMQGRRGEGVRYHWPLPLPPPLLTEA